MAEIVPLCPPKLTKPAALRLVRDLAADSNNIVVIPHAKARQRQRSISFAAIQQCLLKGSISEGPFLNQHGHWQMNFERFAAGEELTVVAAIDWPSKMVVITVF